MDTNKENLNLSQENWSDERATDTNRAKVTHNLDNGEDEPLDDLEDKNVMDFGSGSGGGSATDGGGA
jgi:hypothetical protein